MNLKLFICVTTLCVITTSAKAQMDTVLLDSSFISLRGDVKKEIITDFVGGDVATIGNILSQQALVFVKPGAGNTLSTLSIRGGTAEQSAVFWNGLSLQNALNGNVDLNLIPSFVFDEITLNVSNSVHSGSGATAGSLGLNNTKFDTSNLAQIKVGAGSFSAINAAFKSTVHYKTHRLSLSSALNAGKNNYPIESRKMPQQAIRLENASFALGSVLYQHQFDIRKSNPLNIRLWLQSASRQIPPTLLEASSKKSQLDRSVRFQTDWSKVVGKNEIKLIGGSFLESLNYADSIAAIYTDYIFINNSLLAHFKRNVTPAISIGSDVEFRHIGADADSFYQQLRIEFSEGFHLKYTTNMWQSHIGLRFVQYNTNGDKPLLLSGQLNRKVFTHFDLTALFSTNYRLPTFNNLFWNPGGNPNLTAEKSTNSEVSVGYKRKQLKLKSNVYSNFIKDQIRWIPGGTGIFEASQVLDEIQWNRGVELICDYKWKHVQLHAGFTTLRSTVKHQKHQWQQTYIPLYQTNTGISVVKPSWQIRYGYQFVSRRYTDTENTVHLNAYGLHNAQIKYKFRAFEFQFIAQNIGNLGYAILPFKQNAPRNYQFDISYKLNKNRIK